MFPVPTTNIVSMSAQQQPTQKSPWSMPIRNASRGGERPCQREFTKPNGVRQRSTAFDAPWSQVRACVHVNGRGVQIAGRGDVSTTGTSDLLQAGPLLVDAGRTIVADGVDAEGFAAAAHQFDSDITLGRYPRAGLGLGGGRLIAVVCDGRAADEAGLTLRELADVFVALGANSAINLDGGGSASLVCDGELQNRPREDHGLVLAGGRPVSTALVFEPLA